MKKLPSVDLLDFCSEVYEALFSPIIKNAHAFAAKSDMVICVPLDEVEGCFKQSTHYYLENHFYALFFTEKYRVDDKQYHFTLNHNYQASNLLIINVAGHKLQFDMQNIVKAVSVLGTDLTLELRQYHENTPDVIILSSALSAAKILIQRTFKHKARLATAKRALAKVQQPLLEEDAPAPAPAIKAANVVEFRR
jgi:hypothetical protein